MLMCVAAFLHAMEFEMKRVVLLGCLVLILAGCGGGDLPELGYVTGRVSIGGQPLAGAIVSFSPVQPGRPSSAETDAEGEYELFYNEDAPGAVVGDHVVTVTRITTTELDDLPDDPSEMSAEERALYESSQPLPAAAADGSLKKSVAAGSNEINIEL